MFLYLLSSVRNCVGSVNKMESGASAQHLPNWVMGENKGSKDSTLLWTQPLQLHDPNIVPIHGQ